MARDEEKRKKIILAVSVVAAIASVSFFSYITFFPSVRAKSFGQCKELYDKKDYAGCVECFDSYIQNNEKPESDSYRLRGLSHFNLGNYNKAVIDFTQYLKKDKYSHTIFYTRGIAYEKLGKTKNAQNDFAKACSLGYDKACLHEVAGTGTPVAGGGGGERSAREWLAIGTEFCEKGDYKKALEPLTAAINLNSKMTEAYLYRGLSYRNLNKFNEALKDYNEIIRLEPNNAKAYNNRGVVYWKLGKYNEALADYNKTIGLDQNNYIVYNNRGVVHFEMGDYEKALTDYNKAISLNPNMAEFYWNRAVSYMKLKKDGEAQNDFKKACDLKLKEACDEIKNL
jgi:tetratricopeptide (TPR) repeat protein